MKNKNFLVLVWVLLLSFYAESAAAFPKLQIQPIDLLGYGTFGVPPDSMTFSHSEHIVAV